MDRGLPRDRMLHPGKPGDKGSFIHKQGVLTDMENWSSEKGGNGLGKASASYQRMNWKDGSTTDQLFRYGKGRASARQQHVRARVERAT